MFDPNTLLNLRTFFALTTSVVTPPNSYDSRDHTFCLPAIFNGIAKLREKAVELGFQMPDVYDREDIARMFAFLKGWPKATWQTPLEKAKEELEKARERLEFCKGALKKRKQPFFKGVMFPGCLDAILSFYNAEVKFLQLENTIAAKVKKPMEAADVLMIFGMSETGSEIGYKPIDNRGERIN